ncbi:radical SAM family heme chaperone HemW [Lusitaniella coriacea]|uniref:radical SAM family heme chaperone HemW n=1 Tax=Lusitaniella coriacea TaxID=1983105 RepID=UPI002D21A42B|nr:radical SAM family heme chaperone HemW [Lusitaniella coriacea]
MKKPVAAYVHIPFCRRRCYYCDFPVSVVGDKARGENSGAIARYIKALSLEIETVRDETSKPLATIFFGGGTPSLLSVSQVEAILADLDRGFGIAKGAEISMEMDPGTFDRAQIQGYVAAGINRVSLGVQAFQNDLLRNSGRSHAQKDVFSAVDLLHRAGVTNFSLDLISGLPHQTLEQWRESLEMAIQLAPQHLSCYDLVLEPVTAFGKQYQPGERPLPDDETTAQMYKIAQQALTDAGYDHYEISNYAQPGYQCRHNRTYWENRPYYGLGMGAASFWRDRRFARPRTRREYYAWVDAGCEITEPPLSNREKLLEELMLGLRLADGVNLGKIRDRVGKEIVEKIEHCLQPYREKGWVEATPEGIRLSDPQGFLFSNTILAALFGAL